LTSGEGWSPIVHVPEPVLLLTHPDCELHDPGAAHPERPGRLRALLGALALDRELATAVREERAAPALEADLLRVHLSSHVARVREAVAEASRSGSTVRLDDDTLVSTGSWRAALAAAGCAIEAVERVMAGAARRAFALSRPPGHHAGPDCAMGFCLFNNAAVAVRRLQAVRGGTRVLIIDLDAHHPNGTQDIFYEDGSVYLLSLHLSPEFPGTGDAGDRGTGDGAATTQNIPLAHGTGAAEYRARWNEALEAAFATFIPELVVLSMGFDVLSGDPEGGLLLEPRDLHVLVADLLLRLPAAAAGRVVAVLEGGYALERIGAGFVEVMRALAELAPS
jgi:acetoin utilization deacetylase AcuC-like enzyme